MLVQARPYFASARFAGCMAAVAIGVGCGAGAALFFATVAAKALPRRHAAVARRMCALTRCIDPGCIPSVSQLQSPLEKCAQEKPTYRRLSKKRTCILLENPETTRRPTRLLDERRAAGTDRK